MVIKNPYYNEWDGSNWKQRKEFLMRVSLFDIAVHSKYGSIEEGLITFITWNGVNTRTPWGDKFVKWHHVLEIKKGEV